MKSIRLILVYALMALPFLSSAQRKCGTVEYNQNLAKRNPAYRIDTFEKWFANKKALHDRTIFMEEVKEEVYTIPVVVHIVHNGESIGEGSNISDAQILSQIEVLNEDFRRLNKDTVNTPDIFKPVAADIKFEFKLAIQDPNGQPTDGIVRVKGTKTSWAGAAGSKDDVELKSLSFWPPEDYLNIWVTTLSNLYIGYSQYPITDLPGMISPFDRETDGIVISYKVFGSTDRGSFPEMQYPYDKGRTTSHEIGHFFGLRHIWGDSIGCSGTDYCDDTPNQENSYDNCDDQEAFSCGSEDMYQNYMDYSWDQCMNIFTQDQKERMRIVIENSPRRVSLLSSLGLTPPSDQPDQLQVRAITAPTDITFRDIFNPRVVIRNLGINEVSNYQIYLDIDGQSFDPLTFEKPVPIGSSIELDLKIMTDNFRLSKGQHVMTVGVRAPNGRSDIDLSGLDLTKYFLSDPTTEIVPYIEEFQDEEKLLWSVYNPDNQKKWQTKSTPIANSLNNKAMVMEMYDYPEIGAEDWLVSPIMDLSAVPDANITFLYSYAQNGERQDQLEVRGSVNGGESFPFTFISVPGSQISIKPSDGPWVPKEIADWKKSIVDLNELVGHDSVRIAFVTLNANGNNLILDDLEFHVTGWSDDIYVTTNKMVIHPNPSVNKKFYVTLRTDERQSINFVLLDLHRRTIISQFHENVLNQTFEFDMEGRQAGIYLLWAIGDTFNQVGRVFVK